MLKIEGARPRGYSLIPGPRWRSASCPKKPALGHGYEATRALGQTRSANIGCVNFQPFLILTLGA